MDENNATKVLFIGTDVDIDPDKLKEWVSNHKTVSLVAVPAYGTEDEAENFRENFSDYPEIYSRFLEPVVFVDFHRVVPRQFGGVMHWLGGHRNVQMYAALDYSLGYPDDCVFLVAAEIGDGMESYLARVGEKLFPEENVDFEL